MVQYFFISHFSVLVFRHSCGEVFRHSNSQYLELWSGVISHSAKLFVDVPVLGFLHFAFCEFGTPVMKILDSWLLQLPISRTPKWSYFLVCETLCWCACFRILAFLISRLRDSCDEESRLLTPANPSIWNFEMELFPSLQNSLLMCLFQDFGVSHFTTLGLLWWIVSTLDSSSSRYLKLRNGVYASNLSMSLLLLIFLAYWSWSLPSMTNMHTLHSACISALSLLVFTSFLCYVFPKYLWCSPGTLYLYSSHHHCYTFHQWQVYVAYKTCQQSPPLSLMEKKAPRPVLFSPFDINAKENTLPLSFCSIFQRYQIFNQYKLPLTRWTLLGVRRDDTQVMSKIFKWCLG